MWYNVVWCGIMWYNVVWCGIMWYNGTRLYTRERSIIPHTHTNTNSKIYHLLKKLWSYNTLLTSHIDYFCDKGVLKFIKMRLWDIDLNEFHGWKKLSSMGERSWVPWVKEFDELLTVLSKFVLQKVSLDMLLFIHVCSTMY